MLSEDECARRIHQALCDVGAKYAFAIAQMADEVRRTCLEFHRFCDSMTALRVRMEAQMTTPERVIYDELVVAGTPWLDAILEARILAAFARVSPGGADQPRREDAPS
jgi:hypothetical protein